MTMEIRTDKRGILMPPLHRHVSKHRSYQIAVRTARRRQERTGIPMAIVAWHDDHSVVMPAAMAEAYDDEELYVEFL